MYERQVLIGQPNLNTDPFRDFSTHTLENQDFPRHIKEMGVTPITHPQVIDLCAGNGLWAVRFVKNGWPKENITCVDRAIPNPPQIDGLNWLYWDVRELGYLLRRKRPVPPEIDKLKGSFDCVVTSYGGIGAGLIDEGLVCDFLAREGAFVWPNSQPYIKNSKT